VALVLSMGFYAFALSRRVPMSGFCLVTAVVAVSMVRVADESSIDWQSPELPISVIATVLAAAFAVAYRSAWWGWGTVGLATLVAGLAARQVPGTPVWFAGFHAAMIVAATFGLVFRDRLGTSFRIAFCLLALVACSEFALVLNSGLFTGVRAFVPYYPIVVITAVNVYALVRGDRSMLLFGGLLFVAGSGTIGWREFLHWRRVVPGLDAILLGLLAFAAAVGVSVIKAESFGELRIARRRRRLQPGIDGDAPSG